MVAVHRIPTLGTSEVGSWYVCEYIHDSWEERGEGGGGGEREREKKKKKERKKKKHNSNVWGKRDIHSMSKWVKVPQTLKQSPKPHLLLSLFINACHHVLSIGQRCRVLTLKVLNFWRFTSYCSLKPLWSGMGEVMPARTSPTLHPPSPPTVHQLSRLAL